VRTPLREMALKPLEPLEPFNMPPLPDGQVAPLDT
jgi:hypothetical protein